MVIIACLISYILFDSLKESGHLHEAEIDAQVPSTNAMDEPASTAVHSDHSVSSNKLFTGKKGEAPHEHSLDIDLEDHVHENDSLEADIHTIPERIKKSLCINDNDPLSCTVNMENNLDSILLDKTGNMLAEEITTLLDSKNFQEVIEFLSSQKQTNEAFIREDGYQFELNKLTNDLGVASSPLYCSETICAMTIEYEDIESSKDFFRQFFNKSNKGNIFLSQQDSNNQLTKIERVMFFPENRNGVIIPPAN